jgi:predicted branched-subunit amino acid permease
MTSILEEETIQEKKKPHHSFLLAGLKDGLPIGLGYLAVSFSLGIAAGKAGFTSFQGFVISLFCSASAGEYAAFTLIIANASYFEVAIMTLVANARYLLMSCALSQKIRPETSIRTRMSMGFCISDEIFGAAIGQKGWLSPVYYAGVILGALPMWAIGTALGIEMGEILPANVVTALSVSLYGMFLAIIIPAGKKDKVVCVLVVLSFALSWMLAKLPAFAGISEGMRTILLTVVISAAAAVLFPKKEGDPSHES